MGHYSKTYDLIDISWEPSELHNFLIRKYKHGLFEFALGLATVVLKSPSWGSWNLWILKNEGYEFYEKFKEEIKLLRKIEDKLERVTELINDHLDALQYWDFIKGKFRFNYPEHLLNVGEISTPLNKRSVIRRNYRLDDVCRIINEEIQYLEEHRNKMKMIIRKKGRPVEPHIILMSFWTYALCKSDLTHWENIERLRDWFARRLKGATYLPQIQKTFTPEMILKFKNTHKDILENEASLFFGEYENPINPLNLQLVFDKDEPKFWGLGDSKCSKKLPVIKFTDGSTLP